MGAATAWGFVLGDRRSVRWRIAIGASLTLALTVVVVLLAAAGLLRRQLTAGEDEVLAARLDEIEALIESGSLTPELEISTPVDHALVVTATGDVVASTPGFGAAATFDSVPVPPVGVDVYETIDGGEIGAASGLQYRVAARSLRTPDGVVTVFATRSNAAAHRAESYLRNWLLAAMPALVALSVWFNLRLVRRAFAPIDAMRRDLDRIEATDLSGRVVAAGSDEEIAHLETTLNRMLDRLHDAARRQELFASSASHELRSPLAAIRTELEVGLAYPDLADWPQVAQDCLIDVARLEELSRDLRLLTRGRTTVASIAERFDLAALVSSEVSHRRPRVPISVTAAAGPVIVVADCDGVVRVIRNLLDNAERHAATSITVAVAADQSGVQLDVANDGAPIPADQRERIFDAFTRLDEARSLDAGGSGLGLAIARTVMEANGGTLTALDVDDGAVFRTWFPRPQ